jgi:hypothetical protein
MIFKILAIIAVVGVAFVGYCCCAVSGYMSQAERNDHLRGED